MPFFGGGLFRLRLLIRQQLQEHFALCITVRFRETFLEQGHVLPVKVLLHIRAGRGNLDRTISGISA